MTPLRNRNPGERAGSAHPAAAPRAAESSDAELGARARVGDRHAFARIYERHAPAVHGVLLSVAPTRDVHDLLQDVFLQALRSIDALEEPERLGPWLLAIARNRARDHLRSASHETTKRATDVEGSALASAAPPDAGEDAEESERVLATIRALPESYRETLVLRLVEGLSGPEISARTGLTHGSVRVNLTRGMKLLRERLDAPGEARARRPNR